MWVGWFGFNAGSATAADGRAGMAMVDADGGGVGGDGVDVHGVVVKRKPTALGIVSGLVAGLVAITPASGFVGVTGRS